MKSEPRPLREAGLGWRKTQGRPLGEDSQQQQPPLVLPAPSSSLGWGWDSRRD